MALIKDAAAGGCLLVFEHVGGIQVAFGMIPINHALLSQLGEGLAWFALYLFLRIRDRFRVPATTLVTVINKAPKLPCADGLHETETPPAP